VSVLSTRLVAEPVQRSRTYTARAVSHGDLWVVEVPEVPQARALARRLDQVHETARDAISLTLGVPVGSFDVHVETRIDDDDLAARVEAARALREEALATRQAASAAMEEAARSLATRGFRIRDIGALLGVSFQRAAQLAGGRALTGEAT
jgi:hypothetical protein